MEGIKKTLLVSRIGALEWCVASGCCLSGLVLPDTPHPLRERWKESLYLFLMGVACSVFNGCGAWWP